jgi:hypothetical protein
MKKTLFVLAALAATACAEAQTQPAYDIHVIDARHFSKPPRNWKNPEDVATFYVDIARHKPQEVTVFQYPDYYEVAYYQAENDSIKMHGFNIVDAGQFDKAQYTWNKDTLNLYLFNGTTKTKVYRGYGHGNTNSLKTE